LYRQAAEQGLPWESCTSWARACGARTTRAQHTGSLVPSGTDTRRARPTRNVHSRM
jgi:hypothetical protein